MAKRGDPNTKRKDETDLQWRSRLARESETRRRQGEEVVTPEAKQHGLKRGNVKDEDGREWQTYTRQSRSALAYMRERGSISDDQFYSAQQIAKVAEMIERQVRLGCASMEARVDCSSSAKDALYESLSNVRAEAAYNEWRHKLPLPRRMFIDMVTQDAGLSAIAAEHNMGWLKAKKLLIEALDRWPEIYARCAKGIDRDDIDAAHARLRA